jgi:hypothetical protein
MQLFPSNNTQLYLQSTSPALKLFPLGQSLTFNPQPLASPTVKLVASAFLQTSSTHSSSRVATMALPLAWAVLYNTISSTGKREQ